MEENRRRRQEPAPQAPSRRPRKKRKRKSFLANPWIYLLFVFGLSALLAGLGWLAADDVLALNKTEHSAVITVRDEDSFAEIVDQLVDNELVEYGWLFTLFAEFTNGDDEVSAGTYVLDTDMDYSALLNSISPRSGQRMTTSVTIPEGYNIDQVFAHLEEAGVSTAAKLQETAANHDYAFSFLQDLPLGDYKRLEGYLFPDTYEFYMGEDPLYVINKMLVNFDAKIGDNLREHIAARGLTVHDIVIIASMIEKETDGTDRENISSVIINRLNNPQGETAGFLNVDATLQYVLPEGEFVTTDHYTSLESPYNTYKYQGLPPGPISNPGISSLMAAIYPADTDYYYYALGSDGLHHFTRTYAEHVNFLGG